MHSRSKVACHCSKCNGKLIDPRTRKKHMEIENQMKTWYGLSSSKVNKAVPKRNQTDDNDENTSNPSNSSNPSEFSNSTSSKAPYEPSWLSWLASKLIKPSLSYSSKSNELARLSSSLSKLVWASSRAIKPAREPNIINFKPAVGITKC